MQVNAVETPNVMSAVDSSETAAIGSRARQLLATHADTIKGLLSIIDQAIFSGTSFVTAVIVGRATTPDVLGLYYLTLTIAYVAIGIQECMIAVPYAILSPRRRGRELAEYTASTWIHYFSWSALCLGGLLVALLTVSLTGGATITPGLQVLTFTLPVLLLRESIRRFAFARLRLTVAIMLDATVAFVQLAGLLSLWYLGDISLFAIFGTMTIACAVAIFGWLSVNRPRKILVSRRALVDWRHNWSIAQWSLASFMLSNTIPFIMPWIVAVVSGNAAAGIFGASATLIGMTNVLVLGASNFLMPKAASSFASRGAAGLSRVLIAMALLFVVVIGSFFAAIFVSGDWLAVFVYGAEFHGTGGVQATLAANMLAGSLGMIAAQGLLVIGRQRVNFLIDIGLFSITMISAALLVPEWGPLGAALASLAGGTASTSVRAILLGRALHGMRGTVETR
ncbi:MAG TPA: hypothetical protein VHD36_13315 [Pirellulales bacterium]|nr:hypothetical protein [Pirellulales bacterium]